jgi:hypothetical protein
MKKAGPPVRLSLRGFAAANSVGARAGRETEDCRFSARLKAGALPSGSRTAAFRATPTASQRGSAWTAEGGCPYVASAGRLDFAKDNSSRQWRVHSLMGLRSVPHKLTRQGEGSGEAVENLLAEFRS